MPKAGEGGAQAQVVAGFHKPLMVLENPLLHQFDRRNLKIFSGDGPPSDKSRSSPTPFFNPLITLINFSVE
jgi:hypothetical protein